MVACCNRTAAELGLVAAIISAQQKASNMSYFQTGNGVVTFNHTTRATTKTSLRRLSICRGIDWNFLSQNEIVVRYYFLTFSTF